MITQTFLKLDGILLPPIIETKDEKDEKKLNEIIKKGTKRKNSFSVGNFRKKIKEYKSSLSEDEKPEEDKVRFVKKVPLHLRKRLE